LQSAYDQTKPQICDDGRHPRRGHMRHYSIHGSCLVQNPAVAGISKMFILLGEVSYPVYATHVPIYQLSQFAWDRVLGLPLTNTMPWPALLIVAAAVICMAFMFVRWWDGPIGRRATAELVPVKTNIKTQHD
jgi:peptidoglycan/LPS O-acetylase OafA/YrhL